MKFENILSTLQDAELIESVDMPTISVVREHLLEVMQFLKTDSACLFDQCMDVCGVDYLTYGQSEWETHSATSMGFSRGTGPMQRTDTGHAWSRDRFAVVYHLLSTELNQRVRVKVFLGEGDLLVPSVIELWPSVNWFEREAFDMFGILFKGHPDLRRILTDYGFEDHPLRKDFPLIGKKELRYDPAEQKCVYGPVEINERVLVPRVIREDNRSLVEQHDND